MNSNLANTPNSNVVQPLMVFHSAKDPLNGRSAVENGLPFRRLLGQQLLLGLVGSDDRLRSELSLDSMAKLFAGISSITDNIIWMEPATRYILVCRLLSCYLPFGNTYYEAIRGLDNIEKGHYNIMPGNGKK